MQARKLLVTISLGSAAALTALAASPVGISTSGALLGAAGTAGAQPTTTSSTTSTTAASTTTSTSSTTSTTMPSLSTTSVPASSTTTTAVPTTTTTTVLSAQALLSSAMNAFAAERAVEWTYRIKAYGGSFVEVVHDGVHDGTAHVTLTVGGQVAKLDRVLDGKAFFEGNAAGLTYFADLKAADSKLEAGKWVYVPKDSLFFASYANGLTMSSAVQQLYLGGTVTSLPPKTLSGRKVLEVHEALKSKGTTYSMDVYIRASGRPLPVEAVLTVNGVPATIAFGPWGVPPTAKVPKGAVPFRAVWVSGT